MVSICFIDLTEQTYTFLMTLHFPRALLLLAVTAQALSLITIGLIYNLVIHINARILLHIVKLLCRSVN